MIGPTMNEEPAGAATAGAKVTYVTAWLADQLFGVPIARVQDVFRLATISPVPLAPPEILGLMNLRGRIVTAVDLRRRLGLPAHQDGHGRLAIGIEVGAEAFGLVVDRLGEVLETERDDLDEVPIHLDPAWRDLSSGVHQLADQLLVVVDVDAVLASRSRPSTPATFAAEARSP